MSRPWTAQDVINLTKQDQAEGRPYGSEPEIMGKILQWMNSEDKDWIHISGMFAPRRPGVLLYMTLTELIYFPPKSTLNDYFLLVNLKWEDTYHYVFSVPKSFEGHLQDLAPKCGVRISKGIPTLFSDGKADPFPVQGNNVFNLENIEGHPSYGEVLTSDNEMFKQEDTIIQKAHNGSLDLSAYKKGKLHA